MLEVPDDYVPSVGWHPLDRAAQLALEKLGVRRPISGAVLVEKIDVNPTPAMSELGKIRSSPVIQNIGAHGIRSQEPARPIPEKIDTSPVSGKGGKRPSDSDPGRG